MYLTQPERAKNILQNEVPPDFVFILKMMHDKKSTENDSDWPESRTITAAIFQKSLNLVAGFCLAWVPEIGNEVDNLASQSVS